MIDIDTLTNIRIVVRWLLVMVSLSAVTFMFWYFVCCFTKKKWCRIALVGVLMAISITAYVLNHRHPDVVTLHEDVLYIKPNSK
jgi:hypothetical protein